MAKLRKAVHFKDPDRSRTVLLLPGEEPEPRLAALITNPDAWEDGKLPNLGDKDADGHAGTDSKDQGSADGDTAKKTAPAAKKTAARKTAASKPARGRDAADEGDSGE